MIKDGHYAWYKGHEYKYTTDMRNRDYIYTRDKSIIDDTFIDEDGSGYYTRRVRKSDLDEFFRYTTYGIIDGERVAIRREKDGRYDIETPNESLAHKRGFKVVDRGVYGGWISADQIEVFVEKEPYVPYKYRKHKKRKKDDTDTDFYAGFEKFKEMIERRKKED